MNQHLQTIFNFIQQSAHINAEEKNTLLKAAKDAGKELEITLFKLDRTEKVKRTTAILLEETIEELEQKRKAVEAQNRELEIESSLERVRTVAMSMNGPDDMLQVCRIISEQLGMLGTKEIRNVQTAIFYEDNGTYINYEYYRLHDKSLITEVDYRHDTMTATFASKMTKGPGEFLTERLTGKQLKDWFEFQKTTPQFADPHLAEASSLNYYWFSLGPIALGISTYNPLNEEEINLFKRFRNVFELSYRRFLDIQKAEAQSREAQIQLALERVRARTMAMHKSNELAGTASILFQQIKELGFQTWSCGFCIWTKNDLAEVWMAAGSGSFLPPMMIPYKEEPTHAEIYKALLRGEPAHDKIWEGKELEKHYAFLKTIPSVKNAIDILEKSGLALPSKQCYYVGFFKEGYLLLITKEPNEGLKDLSKRFASVFDLTYTRFLDLQKAEAQVKESQVEAALERVRAQAMAMHKSEELLSVCEVMYKELKVLGFEEIRNAMIHTFNDKNEFFLDYDFSGTAGGRISKIPTKGFPIVEHYMKEIKKSTDAFLEIVFKGEELQSWKNTRKATGQLEDTRIEAVNALYYYYYSIGMGDIGISTFSSISEEKKQVLERFRNVFQLSYQRYHDIDKAEVQVRESQIELSLERVRAKTMAMHNSADVGETAAVMVEELKKLGIETMRCGIGIMHEPGNMEVWTISTDRSNKTAIIIGWLDMHMHPMLEGAFKGWRDKNESYSYELKEGDLLRYYNAINNYPGYPIRYDISSLPEQIHHNEFYFSEGTLFAFSLEQLTDEQRKIFKRFAGVFGQTYRRYLDLQQAEAQARESQVETALERVRSRTLAMQRSDELAETAAVLFRQLIILGIAPNRLYIGVINGGSGSIEFWITDEDGSKVSTMFSGNAYDNRSIQKMYDGWQKQEESLIIDMHGKELADYFHYLGEELHVPFKEGLLQKRRLQYISYFSKGFIGMASPDEQPKETIDLLKRFAYVFNLTFTRFNDLKVAEAHAIQADQDFIKLQTEKNRAEDALAVLKETQKQLVQSEKMASLGELTAGIAHEIQNPLNFVNNFSEVSNELIDEMNAEIEKGDMEEAKAIANDIRQNLEKINHHGKRADAIVKGMLQHSRSSSAVKEPTDINKLADEYLRLAYHGLRAKDKAFNATLRTDYDESIGNINIVPQDIGRVILNLITNAFYVVNEKKLKVESGYKPTVSVTTKMSASKIGISVNDNGGGIPKSILDKIFQPFFTTKPTGQGTGLGLSLAYDIVKAHGGELNVETKEGEGTTFTIQLPAG